MTRFHTVLAVAALLAPMSSAMAHTDVQVEIGIPAPVYAEPPPVYYEPPPAYYYPPPPVYVGHRVIYRDDWRGRRHWHEREERERHEERHERHEEHEERHEGHEHWH